MKKLLAIISLLFLFLSLNLKAQEISTTGFLPNTVRPSAISSYTITVKNVDGTADLNEISTKIPKGLKLLDQDQESFNNISWENGVTKKDSGVKLTLSFASDTEGTYTIGSWNAKVGDKTYPIPAHTLNVDANAPVNVQQSQSPFSSRLDAFSHMRQLQQMMGTNRYQNQAQAPERLDLSNLIEVRLKLPKGEIYVGENIPCEIILEVDKELLSRAQIDLSQVIAQAKDADAFTCQELPQKPTKDADSDPYKILYTYTTIITPNKVGTYPISYNIQGVFGGRSFFSGSYRFDEVAKLESVNVSPLPSTGVPASFTGAIGEFKLSQNNIDPSSASVGELVTQSFSIEGLGNFDRISAPKVESTSDWKVYEPNTEFADKDSMGFNGTKTFVYRMVAQKPDLEYAPKIEFSYFNPIKGEYISIDIPPHKVSISPAAKVAGTTQVAPIQAGQFDIISDTQPQETSATPLFAKVEFWLCQALIIALIALAIMYRRHILFLRENPAIAKNSREKRAAKINLKYAKKYAYEAHPKNFFESAVKAIQFSLSRDQDIQAASITLKDAQKLMEKSDENPQDIEVFFNSIDALNYSGAKAQDFDLIQLEKDLRDICKKLLR